MTFHDDYRIETLVLAAGKSQRFDGIKQLAVIADEPMIVQCANKMKLSETATVTVVLGANSLKVNRVLCDHEILQPGTFSTLLAQHWEQGMGASIAAGVKNLAQNTSHVFIALADQVEISTKQCNLMIKESKNYPDKIVAAFYNGKHGAPAIFPKAYFQALAKLNNDQGARNILRANTDNIVSIDLPEAAKDIDTKADLQAYLANTYKGTKHD